MKRKSVEVSDRTMRYLNRSIKKNDKHYIELFKVQNNLRKQLKNVTDYAYYCSSSSNYYYYQYTTLLNTVNESNDKNNSKIEGIDNLYL
jgi:hypothetical protein